MNDEAAFLLAIGADHNDRTCRLAYADWLEERGDARAELIRIEEEMRLLPVFSDRFWKLKPRRNQLREEAEGKWLGAMRYGTDSQPVFRHGFPDGWKQRWRLIREYTEQWQNLSLGDVGGRADEIRGVEARLGRSLPPSVREFVAFAYDARRQSDYHEVFREVFQMLELAGCEAICLLLQCEGEYYWAVRYSDLGVADPPVHAFHGEVGRIMPEEHNPAYDSVTSLTLDMP